MSEISPIGQSRPPVSRLDTKPATKEQPNAVDAAKPSDSVELSQTSLLLSQLSALPDVRQDLIDQVKAEIDAGSYETDNKIDSVVDALANELGN